MVPGDVVARRTIRDAVRNVRGSDPVPRGVAVALARLVPSGPRPSRTLGDVDGTVSCAYGRGARGGVHRIDARRRHAGGVRRTSARSGPDAPGGMRTGVPPG